MKEKIRNILREEASETTKKNLLKLKDTVGLKNTIRVVNGLKNFIKLAYDSNMKEFFIDNNLEPYRISSEPNLYISDVIVQGMDLQLAPFSTGNELSLGDFYWDGNGFRFKFTAYLRRVNFDDGRVEWRVVGMSGDFGFGYTFITKKNTLGKRARMQIFRQIIDKYNLGEFDI